MKIPNEKRKTFLIISIILVLYIRKDLYISGLINKYMKKIEIFKFLIKEFHESKQPDLISRDLTLPQTNKIITVSGSRRSGKTFYFYQIIKNLLKEIPYERIVYINFEDDRILPINVEDLDCILESYYELYPENKKEEIYLFFDEIQNINNWEIYIRRIYDKEKVRIFVTGSNSRMLSKDIATSLRGRTLTFNIFPLSFKEFLNFNDVNLNKNFEYSTDRFKIKKLFDDYLNFGGFPEVVNEKNNLEEDILRNYFDVMIYRDIVERFSVRNITLLKELSKFILTNISSPFSINAYYTSMRQKMAVSKETLFEYTYYLEESGMIFLVPLFTYSLKRQQTNPKKVYCIDNGLRNAVSFLFSKDEGKLAENIVFLELKRKNNEIFYWKNGGEVDFIVKNGKKISAINVTYSNNINKREKDSLLEFKEKFKPDKILIITKDIDEKEGDIIYLPLWKWLLQKN